MSTILNAKERDGAVSDEQAMLEMMALLDEWEASEPSPWFEGRMMARFREEQTQAPAGWLARMRDRLQFGNPIGYRPLLAGATALLLLAGGGSYFGFTHTQHTAPAVTSRTLQDLQVLDNDDQAIQQMDQLLDGQDDNSSSNGSAL
ncbi:hypothetical protein [Terriglobus sp.]|uniref:hypothetical protein n=1 Tax=Terriglobus sp. TaxID=1889013 RepID=UPI003AFFFC7E